MKEEMQYIVEDSMNGFPLKKVLSVRLGLSRREITRLNINRGLFLNGETCRLTEIVKTGDVILVHFGEAEKAHAQRMLGKPEILFEDDSLIIVNKPAGMPAHSSVEHPDDDMGTLLKKYLHLSANLKPVGRLDKNVSGIMVYAKTKSAAGTLSEEREEGTLHKTYLAVVSGHFEHSSGTLSYRLERDAVYHNRKRSDTGQLCITDYQVEKTYPDHTLVRIVIKTGRTHQIRAGMASCGHPLYGDHLYGGNTEHMHRPALHCAELRFIHPETQEEMYIVSPLPEDMESLLEEKK